MVFSNEYLARIIRDSSVWCFDLMAELCARAGMTEEWLAADGETFESVAQLAAEKLGVSII